MVYGDMSEHTYPEANELLLRAATALALNAGYAEKGYPSALIAPLGRFEGEPWTLPYFFDRIMNGDGDTRYAGEDADCDILDVDETERTALCLRADTRWVAVFYSMQGFLHLVELTESALADLEASYADGLEAEG